MTKEKTKGMMEQIEKDPCECIYIYKLLRAVHMHTKSSCNTTYPSKHSAGHNSSFSIIE